jgi:CBS domain-containing protein
MKVRDQMKRRVFTLREDDDLALAVQMMAWAEIRHLPVVRDGKVVGILTERDVSAYLSREQGRDSLKDSVELAMKAPVQVAHPDDDASEAAARLAQEKIGCLPVVEEGRLVGLLTVTDVVAARARAPFELPSGEATQVREVMTPRPAVAFPDDYLLDAVARMSEHRVRHLPVVDGERHAIGMLADRDVRTAIGDPRRALEDSKALAQVQLMRVKDVMSPVVVTVGEAEPLSKAIDIFLLRRYGALPVVDAQERLVGIVSYLDVLRRLAAR